jgi:hypothetical protein
MITETTAFRQAYAAVEKAYYPNGVPGYADRSRVRDRITVAALDMLRRSGILEGDMEVTAG